MKNQWLEFYKGIVKVRTSGRGIERFINMLTRDGISVWNVKSHGTHALTFEMKLEDAKKLRIYARKSECKIEFIKRKGLPFMQKRMLKNSGFLIGAIGFILVIFVLSNMVWGIEIKGANPATEYKMMKQLKEIGVKKGKLQFFIDTPEGIQRHLTNSIEEITWVGVELKGTTYHLQVVEKNEPEKPEYVSPQNLVAKKKGTIVGMFVEEGLPVVKINDFVKPGDLLVSGEMGNDVKVETVAAKGEVFAETWYKSDVSYPLKKTSQVYTGNEKIKHSLNFDLFRLPIWGFGKIGFEQYEVEENEKKFKFLKWELPISYVEKTYRESEQMTKVYDHKEAIEEAKKLARNKIKNDLGENVEIKGENVLHQAVDNGKVTLSIHFQIIENIAEGQPIIQGDTE
ncbi:sporulation protein YqfD [Cytobacillus horneckiae]|uniref:sporulation protein YqfD n=1 Tax=Cytobacillus horneckiae TaxID=549687 RepID=UPI0034CF0DD6